MRLDLSVTKKQKRFIDATESEVLFGGAAGGGKSYGQMVDALLFALKYRGSKRKPWDLTTRSFFWYSKWSATSSPSFSLLVFSFVVAYLL